MIYNAEWCLHKPAIKNPKQTAYKPKSNCSNPGTILTINNNLNKKLNEENSSLHEFNTNLPLSNLYNVHQIRSNHFFNENNTSKSVSLVNNNNTNSNSNTFKDHCNMVMQLDKIKSDNVNNLLNYTTCSGSSSSGNSSGFDYKRRHRCTLQSITTTMSIFFLFFFTCFFIYLNF